MNERFDFLLSNRFWVIVINAVVLYLQQKGLLTGAELALVTAICAPFVIIRTADRATE